MKSILVRMFSGEVLEVNYESVSEIRKQVYDRYVGQHGRNEIIRLYSFSNDEDDQKEIMDDCELDENEEMILGIIEFEKKMKPKETLQVEGVLRSHINTNNSNYFDSFRFAVKKAGALVAGGSILASFGSYQINDLDVYVHYSKAHKFLDELVTGCNYSLPYYGGGFHQASQYDQSFFRKNNILARFYMSRRQGHRRSQSIDVMIIPDDYPIENVVTNFDLSFCEVWWDGENVYANDPYGVRSKSGVLKPDYRRSLFEEMNSFIVKRINKYKNRGFKIDLCLSEYLNSSSSSSYVSCQKKKSVQESNEEAWAVSKFLENLNHELFIFAREVLCKSSKNSFKLYFTIFPQVMSYQHLIQKIPETIVQDLGRFFNNESCTYYLSSYYRDIYNRFFPQEKNFNMPQNVLNQYLLTILEPLSLTDKQKEDCIKKYQYINDRDFEQRDQQRILQFQHNYQAINDILNYEIEE